MAAVHRVPRGISTADSWSRTSCRQSGRKFVSAVEAALPEACAVAAGAEEAAAASGTVTGEFASGPNHAAPPWAEAGAVTTWPAVHVSARTLAGGQGSLRGQYFRYD